MKLYNEDCFKIIDAMIGEGVKVDLVFTDPPYKIQTDNGGGTVNNVKKLKKSLKDLSDLHITEGYNIEVLGEKLVKIQDRINAYFWCNKIQIPDYFNFYVNKLKCKFDIICWHKTNALPTYSNKYLSDTEYLLYFRKGGLCTPSNYEDAKTYYISPINHKDKKIFSHPTIKPLDITEKIIRNSSKQGDIVFDPFMGSGTTGVACKKLNRNFIGCEIDENYFNIAEDRIMKFTEAFDVPALLADLENMQHIPADIGKLYDCEIYKCNFDGVYLTMEYKTTENTYILQKLVFDRNWDKIQSLRCKFGVDNFEEWVGKNCKVFYENELSIIVL